MTRSDGTFPSYVKLNLSFDDPPKDWNVGVRRCIQCGKNWPNLNHFSPSPCCNAQAGVVADAIPDMGWEVALRDLLRFRFERYYERWNEGFTDEQLMFVEGIDTLPPSEEEISDGMAEIERLTRS